MLQGSPVRDESPILPPTNKSGAAGGNYRMELHPTEAAGKFDDQGESGDMLIDIDAVQELRVPAAADGKTNPAD